MHIQGVCACQSQCTGKRQIKDWEGVFFGLRNGDFRTYSKVVKKLTEGNNISVAPAVLIFKI